MNADRRYGQVLQCVLMTFVVPTVMAAETASTAESGDALEEVIVTAQKQVSTEQKTPISMQVYGAEELTERGVVDLQTLALRDPSLTFAMSTNQPYLALRGVSTGNVTETGNPSVAVATDGIFLNRSSRDRNTHYDHRATTQEAARGLHVIRGFDCRRSRQGNGTLGTRRSE